jgi:hypothetical protein
MFLSHGANLVQWDAVRGWFISQGAEKKTETRVEVANWRLRIADGKLEPTARELPLFFFFFFAGPKGRAQEI